MLSLRSEIARELLRHFFLHERESFYINQLARDLQLDRGNMIKKLKELEEAGLLQSEFRGNQRYYSLNSKCPLYNEYRNIVQKTVGIEKELAKTLATISGIQNAWIFGSYAKNQMDTASDIDLLIVGNHQSVLVYEKLANLQKRISRELNIISMDPKEFRNKKKAKDPFLEKIFESSIIQLL